MTPEQFNALVTKIADQLGGTQIAYADISGTAPEIAVTVDDVDLLLTVEPI